MARIENKRITMSRPNVSEYKGNKVLSLNPDGRTNISFGLGKAMVIMENLPAIAAFLKSDGVSCEMSPELKARVEAFAAEFLPKQGE
jgi:hypothetical protein